MSDVGVALIGYGMMGRAHAYAYAAAPRIRSLPVTPVLRVVSGRDAEAVQKAATAFGAQSHVTDWREAIARDDVDLVDVCTPPGTHAEIVAAAAAAGKAVLCEKPLAADLPSAQAAAQAVREAGVLAAIGFNYRRLPALSLMKRMVDEGEIGAPRLWRATWLSDEFCDPAIPFDWRFERAMGATTIADLGAHLIDLALWIVGDIDAVSAQSATFTETRSGTRVDIDEASSALARFANGARGTFEMARTCVRRPCDFGVEVNGDRGTLRFDYARLNELWFGAAGDDPALYGMRRIRAEHELHPETQGWWPIGQGVGYGASFVNQLADHLERWPDGPWEPDLETGVRVQAVCDAMERAAVTKSWVDVG
jgi:predicted dehydrogenase